MICRGSQQLPPNCILKHHWRLKGKLINDVFATHCGPLSNCDKLSFPAVQANLAKYLAQAFPDKCSSSFRCNCLPCGKRRQGGELQWRYRQVKKLFSCSCCSVAKRPQQLVGCGCSLCLFCNAVVSGFFRPNLQPNRKAAHAVLQARWEQPNEKRRTVPKEENPKQPQRQKPPNTRPKFSQVDPSRKTVPEAPIEFDKQRDRQKQTTKKRTKNDQKTTKNRPRKKSNPTKKRPKNDQKSTKNRCFVDFSSIFH